MVTAPFLLRKRQSLRRAIVLTSVLVWIGAGVVPSHCQQATSNTPVAGVQTIPLDQPSAARLQARKNNYNVTVTGSDWVDTNLTVAPGDSITFTATGDVTLSDGRQVTAEGSARGWKDLLRQFPNNNSPVGALVARIGNNAATVPFAIGAAKPST